MIGMVWLSVVEFYDIKTKTTKRKTRPVLVIGGPRNNDYTVLPISTITLRQNVDPQYGILVEPMNRAILSLDKECFVRTHKQMQVHQAQLVKSLGDMKRDIPDLYLDALGRMEEYQKEIIEQAV